MSDIDQLTQAVAVGLKEHRLMLVTAESCTGGGVAEAVTRIAGSSEWFERGFVTYSNAAKREMLGIKPVTLKKYGAVSEPVVGEMAVGALSHSHAQVAIAVSGIAGPSGGTPEKPVGTVCFCWSVKHGALVSEIQHLSGDRQAVRERATIVALQGLLDLLGVKP
ncbi:MAG: CinA family protein [Pyrinomonadaceae bacterium]